MMKSPKNRQKMTMTTRSAARKEITSTQPHMYTMVASYQELLEIPEAILSNKQNTEIV